MAIALNHRITGPAGPAPAVLFGGSLGTSLTMWEPQAPLADAVSMVAFDHRGHGASPLPSPTAGSGDGGRWTIADLGADVLALMDALELERAAYVGLSIGGMVGMWLAAHAPERISRLALLCTSAHFPDPTRFSERAAAVRAAGSTLPVRDAVVDSWLTPAGRAARPELGRWLGRLVLETPAEGYAGCCEAIGAMDLRADLPSIGVPTLVISGAEDPGTPVEMQAAIAAAIPGARHEVVAGASHLASAEQADAVNALLGDFLTAADR